MRVLVIDDERLARKELIGMLKQFVHIDVVGECSNGEEAVKKIESLRPDMVFLDIQMPGKDGFEVLNELEYVPKVVFVTAFDEYALKAFDVSAMDYLLKPVEMERLAETLKRIEDGQDADSDKRVNMSALGRLGENDQIFLKDGDKCWFVSLKDVSRFQSEGNYVRVHFDGNKPMILRSLNTLEARLDNKIFFRANRKFIVNMKCIERIENWFNGGLKVYLNDGAEIEVSRRQAAKFKESMAL